jgi:hypothetical protein
MSSPSMSSIMSGLFQLGHVTNDFDRGLHHLQQAFELPRWEIIRDVTLNETYVSGEAATWSAHVGLAMCGDLCIELIYPTTGSFAFYKTEWRDDAFCCYLHHYGVHVGGSKAELEAATKHAVQRGGIENAGGNFLGLGDFSYVDMRSSIGKHLEMVALNDAGRNFFADLKAKFA